MCPGTSGAQNMRLRHQAPLTYILGFTWKYKQRTQQPYNALSSFAITIFCRSFVHVQLDSPFLCTRWCRAQIYTVLYSVWVFHNLLSPTGYFELRRLEIFWKINLDQPVGIHDINLDCECLKYLCWKKHAQMFTAGISAVTEITKISSCNYR